MHVHFENRVIKSLKNWILQVIARLTSSTHTLGPFHKETRFLDKYKPKQRSNLLIKAPSHALIIIHTESVHPRNMATWRTEHTQSF